VHHAGAHKTKPAKLALLRVLFGRLRLNDQRTTDFKALQAMKMAMKASKKISTAPAAGMTTGMCLTTFSTGSSDV